MGGGGPRREQGAGSRQQAPLRNPMAANCWERAVGKESRSRWSPRGAGNQCRSGLGVLLERIVSALALAWCWAGAALPPPDLRPRAGLPGNAGDPSRAPAGRLSGNRAQAAFRSGKRRHIPERQPQIKPPRSSTGVPGLGDPKPLGICLETGPAPRGAAPPTPRVPSVPARTGGCLSSAHPEG